MRSSARTAFILAQGQRNEAAVPVWISPRDRFCASIRGRNSHIYHHHHISLCFLGFRLPWGGARLCLPQAAPRPVSPPSFSHLCQAIPPPSFHHWILEPFGSWVFGLLLIFHHLPCRRHRPTTRTWPSMFAPSPPGPDAFRFIACSCHVHALF